MKILFLTMSSFDSLDGRGIYIDLVKYFSFKGHDVFVVSPFERRLKKATAAYKCGAVNILRVKTLNLQKTSVIEKGVGQFLMEFQFEAAIKRFLKNEEIDLLLFTTPPINFTNLIKRIKCSFPKAQTYLLLKDIFPQNAVDLGLIKKDGVRGLLYHYYRRKEILLYRLSDHIGCMSPANIKYLLEHNPEIVRERVDLAPNSLFLLETIFEDKNTIRKKYGLPIDSTIFIYGGNLGKPQGVPFLIRCLDANLFRKDCHFLIIGKGRDYHLLKDWYCENEPDNVTLMETLPKRDYDSLVHASDVGLVFLDHRFTIPNYPSRLLSYLENRIPVLCATDPNTDVGPIAEENGYGYWCESNSVKAFTTILEKMIHSDLKSMGEKGYEFFKQNYTVENTYNAIMKHV